MATDVIEFIKKELSSSFYDAPKENIEFTIIKNGKESSGKKLKVMPDLQINFLLKML